MEKIYLPGDLFLFTDGGFPTAELPVELDEDPFRFLLLDCGLAVSKRDEII